MTSCPWCLLCAAAKGPERQAPWQQGLGPGQDVSHSCKHYDWGEQPALPRHRQHRHAALMVSGTSVRPFVGIGSSIWGKSVLSFEQMQETRPLGPDSLMVPALPARSHQEVPYCSRTLFP